MTLTTRPWGHFEILCTGKDYQLKRLYVKPYHQLSLQSHTKRDEVWTVVSGTGFCLIDDNVIQLSFGTRVTVKKNQKHRLGARDLPLVIIELQLGDYDEDDIVRYVDDYGRINSGQIKQPHISGSAV